MSEGGQKLWEKGCYQMQPVLSEVPPAHACCSFHAHLVPETTHFPHYFQLMGDENRKYQDYCKLGPSSTMTLSILLSKVLKRIRSSGRAPINDQLKHFPS
jgi:hypothetical protein